MEKKLIFIICMLSFYINYSQNEITLTGFVMSKGQTVGQVEISIVGRTENDVTDDEGKFSLKFPKEMKGRLVRLRLKKDYYDITEIKQTVQNESAVILKINKAKTKPQITKKKEFYIGKKYNGGTIFYVDNSGKHGYIVDTTMKSLELPFTKDGKPQEIEGAYSVWDGKSNTERIVAAIGEGEYAAKKCKDYRGGGYNDWFLPARDQLYELYKQKNKVGLAGNFDFSEIYYWSSTMNGTNACHVNFHKDDAKGVDYLLSKKFFFAIREF